MFGTPTSPEAFPLFSILIAFLTSLGKVRAKRLTLNLSSCKTEQLSLKTALRGD
jgi:hypothetical protein